MSKGAVGLVAGYWPEDVYRYLATPGLSLDEALVTRQAKRRGREPAVVTASGRVLTYEALATEVDGVMRALLSLVGDRSARVAIVTREAVATLTIFLGALRARCVALLADPSATGEALARQLSAFTPDLVVVEDGDATASSVTSLPEFRCVSRDEVTGESRHRPKTTPRLSLKAPAVVMPAEGGRLVSHSHGSLLTGALSWGSFLALQEGELFLCARPLHAWEGLYSVLPALFRGGASVLAPEATWAELAAVASELGPSYTMLPFETAVALASDAREVHEASRALNGVFVSVDRPFRVAARQKFERSLGRPVMTVYGRADLGPVLASHPTWYLDEAVGIPVTNVDVWPLNPATGGPLEVPWEAIEYAEVGVKSPMTTLEVPGAGEPAVSIQDGWWRTRLVATMDPSGFFHFLSASTRG